MQLEKTPIEEKYYKYFITHHLEKFGHLTYAEQRILSMRYGIEETPKNLEEISEQFRIPPSVINEKITHAIRKLKRM